jgi:hypothetical protein
MLLFLMGVDYATILIVLLFIIILGILLFYLFRKILKKIMRGTSDRRINIFSRLLAFILAPAFVIGILALLMFIYVQSIPVPSDEEVATNHYKMMEDEFPRELKIGMSKKDVIRSFGENDTTQSTMIYDLSLPDANEKYILELNFGSQGLEGFKRQD